VIEYDFNSKGATKKQIRRIQKEGPIEFDKKVRKWWWKVYQTALQECPVGTSASTGRRGYIGGSLRATIRVRRGRNTTGQYDVARKPQGAMTEYYITAGGGGIVNPNYGREVDYAQAVHDGHMSMGGRFVPPNPFLDRALMKHMAELDEKMLKYMDWIEKTWAQNQPTISPSMRFPVTISQGTVNP